VKLSVAQASSRIVAVCSFIYIYIYIHTHTHTHTHVRVRVRTYVLTYIHTYIHKQLVFKRDEGSYCMGDQKNRL
jgi:hypothetical protein